MQDQAAAFHVAPGEGKTIRGPAGGALTFKARAEQTDGRFVCFENIIAPKDGPPLHVHAAEDEIWYILEGHFRFQTGVERFTAAVGSFVFVPRGTPHCFQNVGDAPARILVMFAPGGMQRFFDEFDALPPGPVEPETFRVLGRASGMEVVGPPLAVSDPL
jgi:mannose-6-phosphate isomerase-like protein (cupin superfamily)